uniref:Cathepsin B n=1 Tax=Rhipicephalus zambeziensis TaxID=60191 RepID=A0A224YDF6_9ACAR
MKVLVLSALFAVVAQGRVKVPPSVKPLSDEMINFINNLNTTWKAGRNFDKNVPMSYLKKLSGGLYESPKDRLPLRTHVKHPDLPEFFDAREQWPNCKSISLIRDQSNCGSCWAFGTVEAISDRICIHTSGRVQVNISAQDVLTCCSACGGCKRGYPYRAWQYYKYDGIVTGGLYGTEDGCQPYSFPPHQYATTGILPPPTKHVPPTPPCKRECREGYGKTYYQDKHYGKHVYTIRQDEKEIRTEIYLNGPVQAGLDIYDDFHSYKRGVYRTHCTKSRGGHIVRILGWGTENGVPYWLAANSWNVFWGDQGYFKILRGNNECGIEEHIGAGLPEEP